ncbi:MAG: DUF192 domain-containing protein [Nitrospiraceae bacterium]|nr:DUF192 domain-containing protein [Nitrospiraceae bacterium]
MRTRKFSFFIITAAIFFLFITNTSSPESQEKITMLLDGKRYTLLTARTTAEKTKGLSTIRTLKGADGMIFYLSHPQKVVFWNKDTHLDLELIWLYKGKIVGRDFLPKEDNVGLVVKEAPQYVDQVVELVRNPRK